MESSKEFPSDMAFEVLTRTSLKTLDACKCVCKEWRQLIHDPTFMPTYCKRTGNVCGFILQEVYHCEYVSTFVSSDQSEEDGDNRSAIGCLPRDGRILAASSNHGILCCTRREGYCDRYYVCKPTTQQWQPLPNPKLCYSTVAVGMVVVGSNPFRYKIFRLSERHYVMHEQCHVHQCEVFDSELWRWRETQTVNLPYGELIILDQRISSCVYVHGSFHWLTTSDNVLAFHDAKQCFHKFPLPVPMHYRHKHLLDYQGELGLSCEADDGKFEFWVMEDTQGNWRKEMVVDLKNLEGSVSFPSPAGFYNAGIILLRAYWEAVFYKVQDGSYNRVKLPFPMTFDGHTNTFSFRSDFEHVDLRRKIS